MHSPAHPFAQDVAHCSDHCGEQPTVWDLPNVPPALKREWLSLETRRHFLARGANALSWAGLAGLLGGGAGRRQQQQFLWNDDCDRCERQHQQRVFFQLQRCNDD